jgi:hypothetical protein
VPFAVFKEKANLIVFLRPNEKDEVDAVLTHGTCERRQPEPLIRLCSTDACIFVLDSDDFRFDFSRVAHFIFLVFDDVTGSSGSTCQYSRVWLS